MKVLMLPIVRAYYASKIGKTAIECKHENKTITVFANGNKEQEDYRIAQIAIHEVGDTFVANSDSKTIVDKKPVFKKGDTVTRQKESYELKGLDGNNQATQFVKGAMVFGLEVVYRP